MQAGTYTNDFAEINTKVTVKAVGGTANLVATAEPPNGKAILTTNTDVTLDGLSFTGAQVGAGNGAGIRYQGGHLTILNGRFADNQNGLLAANDPNGSITIENSEFAHNGTGDGRTHNLYVNAVGQLTIRDSYFHDAVVGHEIKSRAYSTLIEGNRIANGPNGTASYDIDLPNGGSAVIRNNVIEKGPNASNPYLIHYGGEADPYAGSSLTISGNTLLAPASGAGALMNQTGIAASFTDNKTQNIPAANLSNGPANISGTSVITGQTVSTATPVAASAPEPAAAPAPAPVADTSNTATGVPVAGTSNTATGVPVAGTSNTATGTPAATATGTGQGKLVLQVSEDNWGGDAQFVVSVDGKQIGGTQTATASHALGQTQSMTFLGDFGSGQHRVDVSFLNDAWGGTPTTDRNLYVQAVEVNGVQAANGQAALYGNGTQSFYVDAGSGSASAAATLPNTEQPLSTVAPGLLS